MIIISRINGFKLKDDQKWSSFSFVLMIFSFSTMIQPVEAISQKDNIKDIVSLATEPENTIEGETEEDIELEESIDNEEQNNEKIAEEVMGKGEGDLEENIESEESTANEEESSEGVKEEDIITNDNIIDGNMETDRYIIRLKSGKEEATKEKIKNKLKKEIKVSKGRGC